MWRSTIQIGGQVRIQIFRAPVVSPSSQSPVEGQGNGIGCFVEMLDRGWEGVRICITRLERGRLFVCHITES